MTTTLRHSSRHLDSPACLEEHFHLSLKTKQLEQANERLLEDIERNKLLLNNLKNERNYLYDACKAKNILTASNAHEKPPVPVADQADSTKSQEIDNSFLLSNACAVISMPPAATNGGNSTGSLKEGNPVASKEREILTTTIRLPSLESSFAPAVSSALPRSSLNNNNYYGSASPLSNVETAGIQPSLFYLPAPPVLQQQSNQSFSSNTAFQSNAAVQFHATSPSNTPKHFDSIPPF